MLDGRAMKTQRELYAEQFADYVIDGLTRTGIKQAELARRSKVSPQAINQIVNKKPHRLTDKLLLPERETVEAIARAFGDDISIARKAAGYSERSTLQFQENESIEETLRRAHTFEGRGLTEDEIARLRPLLEVIDREIERLAKEKQ